MSGKKSHVPSYFDIHQNEGWGISKQEGVGLSGQQAIYGKHLLFSKYCQGI